MDQTVKAVSAAGSRLVSARWFLYVCAAVRMCVFSGGSLRMSVYRNIIFTGFLETELVERV